MRLLQCVHDKAMGKASECHWSAYRRILVQPPSGCKPQVQENESLCTLRVLELVLKLREIPLRRTDVEATKMESNKIGLEGSRLLTGKGPQGGRMLE